MRLHSKGAHCAFGTVAHKLSHPLSSMCIGVRVSSFTVPFSHPVRTTAGVSLTTREYALNVFVLFFIVFVW
jgi:hypothetical protein